MFSVVSEPAVLISSWISLIAVVTSAPVYVVSPISASRTLIAAEILFGSTWSTGPPDPNIILPIFDSCSLIASLTFCAVVFSV